MSNSDCFLSGGEFGGDGTTCADTDLDGYGEACDCAPGDDQLWTLPTEAQGLLRTALKRTEIGPRTAEMHFYCGVACWFLDQRDWAKFHWCWVQEHLPEDRMYMRCRIASAAENMPYANPELGGHKSRGMIGTHHIVREVERSMEIYENLKPKWKAGDFSAPAEDDDEEDVVID